MVHCSAGTLICLWADHWDIDCLIFTPDLNKPALNKIIGADHPQSPQISNLPFNSRPLWTQWGKYSEKYLKEIRKTQDLMIRGEIVIDFV